ncbi:serine hydrolase [Reyranella sp.]|uniref:serine hydrolase domain-containing protein n=1 Tax=Reyranella sp. TaxID=1929291 RepID=UPI0025FB674F|nr:serine hydrolase [Reyranella sp.]
MRLWLAVLAALVAGFPLFAPIAAPSTAQARDPQAKPWPTESWSVSTPEEQGMDSARLARLVETIGTYRQDSFLIVRNGRIVADAYYAPFAPGISHDQRSITKSVVGTLTAIQLHKGMLDSVDQRVMDLFSDRKIENVDDWKKAMTIQSLLDMTSGMDWREKHYTPDETLMQMFRSPNRTAFVLDRPMAREPGTTFNYGGGNPYLLSALINQKSGKSAQDFAMKELFGPLGIKSARWGNNDVNGVTDGQSGLFLSPHDMARFGYLYLRNGQWEGKQIIPSAWVERAKEGKVVTPGGFHYANLWWSLPGRGAFMARGRHSQLIVVIPRLDVVAVMTGVMLDGEYYPIASLIDDITSAVKSDEPLSANPAGLALLTGAIHQATVAKPGPAAGVAPGSSDLAKTVSGKVYRLADNVLRMKSIRLNFFDQPDPTWEVMLHADPPTDRLAGVFGTDGFYRTNPPAPSGTSVIRGRWLDDRTFEMDSRTLGRGETQTWTLTFDDGTGGDKPGDTVKIKFENTDGAKIEIGGAASD